MTAKKQDLSTDQLMGWDQYKGKEPAEILQSIYEHIGNKSIQMCSWYWASIKSKRVTSLAVRAAAFIFLVIGTIFPIVAALQTTAEQKLFFTQMAVAILATAGLLQLADRIFGWSSGWMRYITTVTTMENLTRAFQMEWAKYLAFKKTDIDEVDVKALFELAKGLEQELLKLQAEETTKWVAEFNTGLALLETMIKSQREETDKKLEAIRTSLTVQETNAKANEVAQTPGALEVALTFKGEPKPVMIGMDENEAVEFLGSFWAKNDLRPGRYIIRLTTQSEPSHVIEKIADIKSDSTTRLELIIGE